MVSHSLQREYGTELYQSSVLLLLLSDVDKTTVSFRMAVIECRNWSPGAEFGCQVQNSVLTIN